MRFWTPLAIAALLALPCQSSPAQITTAVVPPRPDRPVEDPVEVRVRRAERLEARITEMREWVDSVAIALDAEPTVPDTVPPDQAAPPRAAREGRPAAVREVQAPAEPRQPPPAPREPPRPTAFREGAPAPSTATSLPLLALLGATAAGLGALLRRRR